MAEATRRSHLVDGFSISEGQLLQFRRQQNVHLMRIHVGDGYFAAAVIWVEIPASAAAVIIAAATETCSGAIIIRGSTLHFMSPPYAAEF